MGGMFDVAIVPGAMTLAWAYGTADGAVVNLNAPVYEQHSARGGASVDFLDGTVSSSGGSGSNVGDSHDDAKSTLTRRVQMQTQGSFTSPDGVYRLTWTVPATRDVIRFDMEADTAGWIGSSLRTHRLLSASSSQAHLVCRRRMGDDERRPRVDRLGRGLG